MPHPPRALAPLGLPLERPLLGPVWTLCKLWKGELRLARYISKPSEIEAVQWTGDNVLDVLSFMDSDSILTNCHQTNADARLLLLAGKDGAQEWVPVPVGHWIVRQPGDLTDHWPVDPDYFAKKYEPVERTIILSCLPCDISYTFTGDDGSCAEEHNEFFLGHGGCRYGQA